jgi:hypothetical protein
MKSELTIRKGKYHLSGNLAAQLLAIAEDVGTDPQEVFNYMLKTSLDRAERDIIPLPCVVAQEWDDFRYKVAKRKKGRKRVG